MTFLPQTIVKLLMLCYTIAHPLGISYKKKILYSYMFQFLLRRSSLVFAVGFVCVVFWAEPARATTFPPATITGNATWTVAASPYRLSEPITVSPGATLTIDPGVIVKAEFQGSLTVHGTLHANGTSAAPITFTSLKDDSVGGDTNGDGAHTRPTPGDWFQVGFEPGSSGEMAYVNVRYGGHNWLVGRREGAIGVN